MDCISMLSPTDSSIQFEKEIISTLSRCRYKYVLYTVNPLTEEQASAILTIADFQMMEVDVNE